jgi:recombination protein RecA
VEIEILGTEGISREGGLIDMGVATGVLGKTGAWFTYGETRLGQGREAAKEFLKNNGDIAADIDGRIRGKISEVALPVEGIEEAE